MYNNYMDGNGNYGYQGNFRDNGGVVMVFCMHEKFEYKLELLIS